ncbi:Protein NUCLEAR FUSION DEFECTIVE 4 [Linum grandiflorum]
MLFGSLLIMSVNGTSYMFGLYSGQIKSSLGYDQTTLNKLSFYKDLGGNLGFLAGFAYEVIPPWTVISIGSIMNFSGYFLVWLSVTNRIPNPHLWQMCIYICLATHAASYPNTAALVACVNNFPENRGSVIGLLKGLIGLSGAILTQIYHAGTNGVASGSSTAIILLIAWLPAIVPLLFSPVVRAAKFDRQEQENKEIQVLYRFLYFAIGLAGFIMFVIVFQNRFEFNRAEYIGTASVVVLGLLLPLAIVVREEFKKASNSQTEINLVTRNENTPDPPKLESCFKNIFNRPDRGEDYSILQAICSVDMAIIFVATTCGVGGALAAIDNLGQIAESLGYKNRTISTFISLISIWNFLGRVLAGFASEILLTRYNFPRPVMLSAVVLLSCAGHILIAVGVPNSLYFASILSGFCLGAQLPLVSAIISEIFGLKHFATLYSVGSVSSPVGSLIFNVKVAGRMYDEEALRQLKGLGMVRGDGKELKCVGVRCFRTAFLVISAASFVGFLVSVVLVWRTKEFYRSDVYKKYRTESEEASATRPENEA